MEKLFRNASVLAAGAIVTAILAPVLAKGLTPPPAPGFAPDDACVGNAKLLLQAINAYTQDYDGALPPTDSVAHFQSAVSLYLVNKSAFTCPATHLSFVPNPAIGGHTLYEYEQLSGNVVVFRDAQPHVDHMSTVAFLDGHVERGGVETGDLDQVCVDRVKQLTLAVQQYVQGNDQRFPPMQSPFYAQLALKAYTHGAREFICPTTGQPFEFNASLSSQLLGTAADSSHTVLIQDMIAHADGIKTVGYVDGHVTHGALTPTLPVIIDAGVLKHLGVAISQYAQDYDEKLPPMHNEQEFEATVLPYAKYLPYFVNPLTGQNYELNSALSGVSRGSIPNPSKVWLARDQTLNADGTFNILTVRGFVDRRFFSVAQHISMGPNNETRLLWNRADGKIVLSRLSPTGAEINRALMGQAVGMVKSVVTSLTGYTHILIGNSGGASLWTLNPSFYFTQKVDYGPYDGWASVSVAVGGNNQPRLLWNRYDKSSAIWQASVANDYVSDKRYALASGDIATGLAVAPDNTQRLVWTRPSGEVRFWTLSAAGDILSQSGVPPYHDWKAKSVTVGPNGNTWVLFAGTGGSSLMTMSATQQRLNKIDFPAEPGWTPQEVGVGADGYARILATNVDGRGRLRIYNTAGALLSSHEFAPF